MFFFFNVLICPFMLLFQRTEVIVITHCSLSVWSFCTAPAVSDIYMLPIEQPGSVANPGERIEWATEGAVMSNKSMQWWPTTCITHKGSMRLPFPSRNMLWNPETNKNCWCSMLTGDLQQWFSPLTERGHKRATEVSRESANLKHCRWGTINLPCVCGERHHLPDLVYVTCRLMICSCFNWYILYWFAQGNMYSHTACLRHSYWSRTMTNGMNASDCRQSL